jgi:hypothetical protein
MYETFTGNMKKAQPEECSMEWVRRQTEGLLPPRKQALCKNLRRVRNAPQRVKTVLVRLTSSA